MARTKTPDGEFTRSELDILQVLWEHGHSTVRFINDELNKKKRVPYTSTLKIMQLMHEKGMLLRDSSQMTHIYFASIKEEPTKKFLLKRFVESMYGGSATRLMVQLLGAAKPSRKELETLKELLKKMDKK